MAGKSEVIRLYRLFLRESTKFTNYNFRSYAIRKVKDTFREHQDETDPEKIKAFLNKAQVELESLRRQTLVSNTYGTTKLVIEQ